MSKQVFVVDESGSYFAYHSNASNTLNIDVGGAKVSHNLKEYGTYTIRQQGTNKLFTVFNVIDKKVIYPTLEQEQKYLKDHLVALTYKKISEDVVKVVFENYTKDIISEMPKLVQTPILDDKINDISKKIKEMSLYL